MLNAALCQWCDQQIPIQGLLPSLVKQTIRGAMSKDGSPLKKLTGWLRGHSKSASSSRAVSPALASPAAAPKGTEIDGGTLPLESVSGVLSLPFVSCY
jgi:hypothetical protein